MKIAQYVKKNGRRRNWQNRNKSKSSEINPNNGFDLLHSTFTIYNTIPFISSLSTLSKKKKTQKNRRI